MVDLAASCEGKLATPAVSARPRARSWPNSRWIKSRLKKLTLGWREALVAAMPGWVHRTFGPVACYLDMLLVDHGIFRLVYANQHRLGERAWRSAQPAPHNIRALARRGLRTIVNLRGERMCGSYWLERAVCAHHGIALHNFRIRSRSAPSRDELRAARDLFERIEYPMLMHCKSGADRAGLMSALYRHVRDGIPLAVARRELSVRYGHFRQADTGILDHLFDCYIEDTRREPMAFFEWVDNVYDPEALTRSFRAKGWANRLVDRVLARE